tara:strand:- start:616 stop:1221 length:606 start_codon:yes stop_codon:yes gene_type:complete
MNVYQIVCLILLIILLVLSLVFLITKEKYQDMNSVHNHLTELENRIYSVERKDDNTKPSTENNLGNDKPEYVQKSIIGKDSIFYLPINGSRQNFLCKVTRPSHTDFYDEIGIIGQNSNGSTISNFADDYNIIYSFYEKLDMVQKNKYIKTWETMVSPNNWNGLIKPYVLIRERSNKNNPEWEEGWLQVNVYPVGNIKRSNV